jgi:hypothetical protein
MKLAKIPAVLTIFAIVCGICCTLARAGSIMPTTKGCTWHYQFTGGANAFAQTITASNPTHFTQKETGTVSTVVRYKLGTKGWELDELGKMLVRNMGGRKVGVKVIRASGVVIPNASLWKPGYKWVFATTYQSSEATGPFKAIIKTTIDSRLKITGLRRITVPAGTFKCYRVRVQESVTSAVSVAGQVQTHRMVLHLTEYYAKGVGLIERKANHMTARLVSYKIAH